MLSCNGTWAPLWKCAKPAETATRAEEKADWESSVGKAGVKGWNACRTGVGEVQNGLFVGGLQFSPKCSSHGSGVAGELAAALLVS